MAEITGRKVLIIVVSAFSVVIAVNLTLAWQAVATFPGLEVKNSYVASQTWNANRAAQQALGWTLEAGYDRGAGQLRLSFRDRDGQPVAPEMLEVLVGRPTETRQDQWPAMLPQGGDMVAPLDLGPGKWMLRVHAVAPDGTVFQQRLDLFVLG